jgi:ribosomal protein S4
MNVPSHKVEEDDVIGIRQESRTSPLFATRTEMAAETKTPEWLKLGEGGFEATVASKPITSGTEVAFNAPVIIQFYSR